MRGILPWTLALLACDVALAQDGGNPPYYDCWPAEAHHIEGVNHFTIEGDMWSPDGVTWYSCAGSDNAGPDPWTKPAVSPDAVWSHESTWADADLWCGVPELDDPGAPLTVTLRPTSDYDLCVWEADESWREATRYARCFSAIIAASAPAGFVAGSGKSKTHTDVVELPDGIDGRMICADRWDPAWTGSWVLEIAESKQ